MNSNPAPRPKQQTGNQDPSRSDRLQQILSDLDGLERLQIIQLTLIQDLQRQLKSLRERF